MYYAAIFLAVYLQGTEPPEPSFFTAKDRTGPYVEKVVCEVRLAELQDNVDSIPKHMNHTVLKSACMTREDWKAWMGYDLWYKRGEAI